MVRGRALARPPLRVVRADEVGLHHVRHAAAGHAPAGARLPRRLGHDGLGGEDVLRARARPTS